MKVTVEQAPCNICGEPSWITSYWGEPLCQSCCHDVAQMYDERGFWPANIVAPKGVTPGPLARSNDPWSAKLAAERIEPTRDTKCAQVLAYLRERKGQWVNGLEFRTPEVGGASGDRRCRELKERYGFNIERRPDPSKSGGVWQYKLTED